jgi:hypothetical protein
MGAPRGNKNAAGPHNMGGKQGKGKRKTFNVTYTKKIGGKGVIKVKARNRKEAVSNAKNQRYTGKSFRIHK